MLRFIGMHLVFKSYSSTLHPFPQLSVSSSPRTHRANEQTATDTPHKLPSIYHLLSIASLYRLVFSSLHLNAPLLSPSLSRSLFPAKLFFIYTFANIISGCFTAPFSNERMGEEKRGEK